MFHLISLLIMGAMLIAFCIYAVTFAIAGAYTLSGVNVVGVVFGIWIANRIAKRMRGHF